MKKARFFLTLAVTMLSLLLAGPLIGHGILPGTGVAYAQEDWQKEFEDICSKTQDAMAFTPDELRTLVARCDTIKPLIENLTETPRKVYLKRLRMCRDLFVFALESKENK